MPDREKVINGLREMSCRATWKDIDRIRHKFQPIINDALALLKEQEEETTFVYDEYTLPTCEKCGFHPFAGYIPTIKWMKERGYMKCPKCGRTVKWK